jgi:hypothetical protein
MVQTPDRRSDQPRCYHERGQFTHRSPQNRKAWRDTRLNELADIFAVAVGGLSVMEHRQISRKAAEPQNQRTSNPKVQNIALDALI